MAVTLNALKKAPILDQGAAPLITGYSVTSSNPAIVGIAKTSNSSPFYAVGIAAGTATVTATRALDGAVASLDVEVVAAAPFAISLGAEVPA